MNSFSPNLLSENSLLTITGTSSSFQSRGGLANLASLAHDLRYI